MNFDVYKLVWSDVTLVDAQRYIKDNPDNVFFIKKNVSEPVSMADALKKR